MNPLHADAFNNDPIACLALADQAEEQGNLILAEQWRLIANPPNEGWEELAYAILNKQDSQQYHTWRIQVYNFSSTLNCIYLWKYSSIPFWCWTKETNIWHNLTDDPCTCPDFIKNAVIAACKLILIKDQPS